MLIRNERKKVKLIWDIDGFEWYIGINWKWMILDCIEKEKFYIG